MSVLTRIDFYTHMISETVLLTGPYYRDLHQYNHDCYKCLLNCICSTFFCATR